MPTQRRCHRQPRVIVARRLAPLIVLTLLILAAPNAVGSTVTAADLTEGDSAAADSAATAVVADRGDVPVLQKVVITGNTKTGTAVILREIAVAPGDPFPEDMVDPIWDHLEDLGYFAFVDIEYNEYEPGQVILHVAVEEDNTFRYGPLIRYSVRDHYHLGGWIRDENLGGKGEVLSAEAIVVRIQRLRFDWMKPWLFSVRGLELRLGAGYEQGYYVWRPTDYRQWRGDGELYWNFLGPFFAAAEVTFRGFEQRDTFDWQQMDRGPGTGDQLVTWPASTRHVWIHGGSVGLDTRDNPYYPRHGVYGVIRGLHHEPREYAAFNEWVGDARAFIPTPWEHVLALWAWGRWVSGPGPFEDYLYFGGPENLRGYRFFEFEGEHGYLLSVEYRAPLFQMPISPQGEMIGFGLHAFADAGDTWFDGASSGEAKKDFGVGAHLLLGTMQLRFEVARTADGDTRFQFMDRFNF